MAMLRKWAKARKMKRLKLKKIEEDNKENNDLHDITKEEILNLKKELKTASSRDKKKIADEIADLEEIIKQESFEGNNEPR